MEDTILKKHCRMAVAWYILSFWTGINCKPSISSLWTLKRKGRKTQVKEAWQTIKIKKLWLFQCVHNLHMFVRLFICILMWYECVGAKGGYSYLSKLYSGCNGNEEFLHNIFFIYMFKLPVYPTLLWNSLQVTISVGKFL